MNHSGSEPAAHPSSGQHPREHPAGTRVSHPGMIILAAGRASRMGASKQLLEWHGQPMVRHAVRTALASVCSPVVAVIGSEAGRVRDALSGLPVQLVENADWDQGVGTSIRTGVQALCAHGSHSLILTLADLPLLTADCYNRLFEIHRATGKTIVASEYSGTVGVPALFGQDVFEELLSLENAQGCKGVLMRHGDRLAGVDCPAAAFDIDTPEDYRRFRTPPPGPRDGIQPSFPPT